MKIISQTAAVILSALLLAFSCSCGEKDICCEDDGFYFDTYITIRTYGSDDKPLRDAFALCDRYDRLFDATDADGDIWAVNHSDGQPVEVSDETAEMLRKSLEYSALSGGRFDVTCGTVTSLWDFHSDAPRVPSADELESALGFIGADKLHIDGNRVWTEPGTQLDVGGIAKGYIADRLAECLRGGGIENAVINLGGNVVVIGDKFGEKYSIGIQSPFSDGYWGAISVSDCSVVTAGTYQRGFELDGVYYHHILDLETGMPADTGVVSVTVVSPYSADGDAIATTLFLMGAEDGLMQAEAAENVEALFILADGEAVRTSGFEKYERK